MNLRILGIIFYLALFSVNSFGQFSFDAFPKSLQLYQRNENNLGNVPIGVTYDINVPYSHFSLTVSDESGAIIFYRKQAKI
jgi:hypothetical protein